MNDRRTTRVLVVEDSPTQAKKLELVLRTLGFEYETARDGLKALELFHASEFDLVLSDVVMPGLSGYDLCRRIKDDPRGRTIPVVLLTSLSKPIDMIRGLESGADNYISKPFQEEALAGRIRSILATRSVPPWSDGPGGDDVYFMGQELTIKSSKEQILNFLGSTFEDFVHARQREFEGALAQEKQNARAETYRIREELTRKEKETLRHSHQFLQSTLDALAVRIAILDASGEIMAVNTAWHRLAGEDPLAGVGCDVGTNYLLACRSATAERAHEASAVAVGIADVIARRREEYSHEYACQAPEGRLWFAVRVTRFDESRPGRVVVAHEDITQRKIAEEQLLHEAYHDSLTGLPNRALFIDRLSQAALRSRSGSGPLFAVLFLDLDGFKVINDSLGHMVGDELLKEIGLRLGAELREGDTIARFGGDEFAILINDMKSANEVIRLAERIRKGMEAPFWIADHEVFTSVSIGIALGAAGHEQPVDLLRDADTAMYRAKAHGKARHVVFDKAMHAHVCSRLKLETDLRRAIERQEFRLDYQPIVALETGRITGFEALVRWDHPERGLVSPIEFISAAEETGLIIPLDLWVLREACRQMGSWQQRFRPDPPLTISVNLSGKDFTQAGLLDRIDLVLRETGLDARCLRLEITESVIMGNTESAIALIRQLKERGLGLSMDDFGTGYSSLSYLHKFSFDVLKVDRSFVSRMGPDGENSVIVETIVALAHSLGMQVVAEGVETAEQAERLRALNCQYGQGYYFSRPVGPSPAEAMIAEETILAPCLVP
jgi:diguanylate cyclase (GGDEF)-like protein